MVSEVSLAVIIGDEENSLLRELPGKIPVAQSILMLCVFTLITRMLIFREFPESTLMIFACSYICYISIKNITEVAFFVLPYSLNALHCFYL